MYNITWNRFPDQSKIPSTRQKNPVNIEGYVGRSWSANQFIIVLNTCPDRNKYNATDTWEKD